MKKIIVIGGPTASGKSTLALELANKLDGEIINADSMQIYKEMNIGTAKPTPAEMKKAKHHLFNIRSVTETFSVADYQKLARKTIDDIFKRKHVPILIGGTGLYLKSVLFDYDFSVASERQSWQEYDNFTNDELYQKLEKLDPEAAHKTHPHNRKRVIQALEICASSGTTKTALLAQQDHKMLYDCIFVGLTMSRRELYHRIDERVDEMMKEGLTGEAETILKLAPEGSTALQAIGYKEFKPFFNHTQDIIQTVNAIKTNTRHYAKRQYTFFNNQFKVDWYNLEAQNFERIVADIVSLYKGEEN